MLQKYDKVMNVRYVINLLILMIRINYLGLSCLSNTKLRRLKWQANTSNCAARPARTRSLANLLNLLRAFPIFDSTHPGAIASLNMPYLKQRDATMSLAQSRQVLQSASKNITELMGGSGHPLFRG